MTPQRAIELSCKVWWPNVLSSYRKASYVDARTFYAVLRRTQGESVTVIGQEINRDHSDVSSLLKRHDDMLRYPDYKRKFGLFLSLLEKEDIYGDGVDVLRVRFKKTVPEATAPTKAHHTDAGFDLTCVSVEEDRRHNCVSYGTGIAVEIPNGYVGLVFPRSSVYKEDIDLSNCVGVIDSGYRGEISAKYRILQPHIHRYTVGDRIGQLIIMPYPTVEWVESDELSDSDRGTGGYGSTGR